MKISNAGEIELPGSASRIDPAWFPQALFAPNRSRDRGPAAAGGHVKRAIDIVLSGLLLVFVAPIFLGLAAIVRTDGGPTFFKQRRVGRGGQAFDCLKFRTMATDAETALDRLLMSDPAAAAEWRETRKLRSDPRITPVGRFLRATSIDELPQLINVLRGEMSLVGPRPVPLQEYRDLYVPLGGAAAYLSVRPGLTGLWQVSGRSTTSYRERVALDATYVKTISLVGDLRILARTVGVVLRQQGAW